MKLALAYDTETTGLPLFKEPSEHPGQPHIVQLGALLVDLDTRIVHSTLDVIIRPEGWTIPDEVAAIHGITQERAMLVGVSEALALRLFLDMWDCTQVRIAHNEQFDARIVRIGLLRHKPTMADPWKAGEAQCTQQIATPILNLPPTEKMVAARMRGPKSANLGEAYLHFMGKPLENAHSALADARGCLDVFFAATSPALEPVAA